MIVEDILEPDLPIIDAHHHMWDMRAVQPLPGADRHPAALSVKPAMHYMLDQLLADVRTGHNVIATVYMECRAFSRASGPDELRPVGETEVVNGVAAMTASGIYGEFRACAGIVGHADLDLGDRAAEVLQAHIDAGGGRFRGVRHIGAWDEDPWVVWPSHVGQGLYRQEHFRRGFARLAPLGLSFDVWVIEPQLADVIDLARAFPETAIVLDHCGGPVGIGRYQGKREERFPTWRASMAQLADCPNVVVKIGGLGYSFANFPSLLAEPRFSSVRLADQWRPYVDACIELFGADRCMFESNFPPDMGSCSYPTLWNAFKRLAAGASADEKASLFSETARRVYRLELPALSESPAPESKESQ
ncbi:MAG TPA: amidohydrolase family protein [Novosphingobium sp.]|nr:amidohydrolase family protein [Novosphingobium sp.]